MLDAFGTQGDKFRVVYGIVVNLSQGDLDGAVGHIVDEGAVMAYEYNRLGFAYKEVFEPLYRFDIEVVGWLVEQKYVGALQ